MLIEQVNEALCALYDGQPLVVGKGPVPCPIMFIGEAPGAREIELGIPFSGMAGSNLGEFLAALGLAREDIYITNVCKFRPTRVREGKRRTVSNRTPTAAEVRQALPFLFDEIQIVNPRLIVALGNTPLRAVMDDRNMKVGDVHGRCLRIGSGPLAGRCVFALYHPASIIYNRALETTYREDLERLKEVLQELDIVRNRAGI